MIDPFMDKNFLLGNRFAEELHHRFMEPLPIIDCHGPLSPRDIAEDRRFENLTQIRLAGDHYKLRAMRAAGVDERFITGDATNRDKFLPRDPEADGGRVRDVGYFNVKRYFGF